jgi:hypothetical protein
VYQKQIRGLEVLHRASEVKERNCVGKKFFSFSECPGPYL